MNFPALLVPLSRRWKAIPKGREEAVAKILLLRDLEHAVHREKSRALAAADPELAQSLHTLEQKIQSSSEQPTFPGSLEDLLQSSPISPLPQIENHWWSLLPSQLTPEKLTRYDRKWERRLAREALLLDWEPWLLHARVPTDSIQTLHEKLNQVGWNRSGAIEGFLLMVESEPESVLETEQESLWAGRWYFLVRKGLHPSVLGTTEENLERLLAAFGVRSRWEILDR
jgi:hypothetical protein